MKKLILFFSLLCLIPLQARADTVHLKNGDFKKGMVVEDYTDRIVFSTVDGEVVIMKEGIEEIEYDDPEMNLMGLGDAAFQEGRYKLAYRYYTLALEINPESDMIREKADQAGLFTYKEREISKRELIEKRAMLESEQAPVFKEIDPEEILKEELGIILARTDRGSFRLDAMLIDSPFRKAGLKLGDHIVSVWTRLASYLTLKEMTQLLLTQDQHIIKLALERKLKLRKKTGSPLGVKFVMEWKGMVVKSVVPGGTAGKAGLKEGDLLVSVNNESIRYTKIEEVLKLLNQEKEPGLIINREVTVFRSG